MDIYMTHGRIDTWEGKERERWEGKERERWEGKERGRINKQRDNGRGIDLPKFFNGTYINLMNF